MIQNNKFYSLVEYRGYKRRLYDEQVTDSYIMLYSELEVYFQQLKLEGFDIKIIFTTPAINSVLNDGELNYLRMKTKFHDNEKPLFYFSDNLTSLKNLQYHDFLFFCKNLNTYLEILFFIPRLSTNRQYFYEILIATKNPNIDNLIIHNTFNLIKIEKVVKINQLISFDFLKNFLNVENTLFFQAWIKFLDGGLYREKHGADFPFDLYNEIILKSFCYHIYYRDSFFDLGAFTNFSILNWCPQLVPKDGKLELQMELLYYPITDLLSYNRESLPFMTHDLKKFLWTVADYELEYKDFLESLEQQRLKAKIELEEILNKKK